MVGGGNANVALAGRGGMLDGAALLSKRSVSVAVELAREASRNPSCAELSSATLRHCKGICYLVM